MMVTTIVQTEQMTMSAMRIARILSYVSKLRFSSYLTDFL